MGRAPMALPRHPLAEQGIGALLIARVMEGQTCQMYIAVGGTGAWDQLCNRPWGPRVLGQGGSTQGPFQDQSNHFGSSKSHKGGDRQSLKLATPEPHSSTSS